MAKRVPRAPRHRREPGVLERILTTPQLARVVPQLQPEVLHRVIEYYGLEDCGELVSLATPDQLARVFDLDLWRAAAPGRDEQFDAGRFGQWLELMVDTGVSIAASKLAAIDADLVAIGLVQHARVFDAGAVSPFITLEGDVSPGGSAFADGIRADIGGFVVVAKRVDHWDAITSVLTALADEHGEYFNRLMRASCRQSSSRPEIDGLDDLLTTAEQAMFDVAVDREARGDAQGYVTPAQARAFLQASRQIDFRQRTSPGRDPVTHAYFTAVSTHAQATRDQESPEAIAALLELLREAGVTPRPNRALLEGPQPRFALVRSRLQYVDERSPDASAARNAELAYLANVIVVGASIQSRAFAPGEASDGVLAVCNLGLENWPVHWRTSPELPEEFLVDHDLVRVFQVGWTVLHEDVCMYAAETLIDALAAIESADADVQAGLETLRRTLLRHWRAGTPWHARDALDVIATLDPTTWVALLSLIDQFPTMHGALSGLVSGTTRPIDPAAFEFIADNAQIRRVGDFMQMVPTLLGR